MNNILKKQYLKLVISVIACIFVGGVFAVVLIKMKTRFEQTSELKERLISYQINKKAFNEEASQILLLQKRLESLESKVVRNESVPELLSGLEALAESNQTKFEITSVQTATEEDKQKLIIEFRVDAPYEQITQFFDQLEHQSFQIRFKDIAVFSEQEVVSASAPTEGSTKPKAPVAPQIKWHSIATIEVISFQ